MLVRNAGLAGLVAITFAGWGCDDDEPSGDEADHDHDHQAESGCAAEDRDDTYMLGMQKSGTALTVRFVDAQPAPPDRYDNTWIVEVLDAAGAPVDDATLVVEPFMPDHNHGSTSETEVTKLDAPGQLKLEPIYLFMPGLWEVRMHFTLADHSRDDITFSFCIDP